MDSVSIDAIRDRSELAQENNFFLINCRSYVETWNVPTATVCGPK